MSTRLKTQNGIRFFRAAIFSVIMSLAAPCQSAVAADISVGCTGNALVDAVTTANANGGDTLNLTPYCLYDLTVPADGENGLPIITTPVIINGNKATIRRRPGSAAEFRLIEVASSGHLTATDLTLMNGAILDGNGGAVNNNGGTLDMEGVSALGNTALKGGGLGLTSGTSSITNSVIKDNVSMADGGGGVYIGHSPGTATLTGLTIEGNRSSSGGGIYKESGSMILANSNLQNNFASGFGGGIFVIGGATGTQSVTNSSIIGNVSRLVGGGVAVAASGQPLTINDSRITGNTVQHDGLVAGGGLYSSSDVILDNTIVQENRLLGTNGEGAGIRHTGGDLTLVNGSDITGNLASGQYSQGGGLSSLGESSTVRVENSAISLNTVSGTGSRAAGIHNDGAEVSLINSPVTENTAPSAPAPGGIWTNIQFATVSSSPIVGNSPTNCLQSPVIALGCAN